MQINVDLIYPIGSLYLTTSTVSPQILFGGKWEKITNDAYLKIASGDTAGNLGGTSSDHKIPVTSMPSHNHRDFYQVTGNYGDGGGTFAGRPMLRGNSASPTTTFWNTDKAGGGQAYYPYYYDVFVWKRIA